MEPLHDLRAPHGSSGISAVCGGASIRTGMREQPGYDSSISPAKLAACGGVLQKSWVALTNQHRPWRRRSSLHSFRMYAAMHCRSVFYRVHYSPIGESAWYYYPFDTTLSTVCAGFTLQRGCIAS